MQAPKGFQRKIPMSIAVNQLLKSEVFLKFFYKFLRVFTIALIFSLIQINIKMKWFFVISLLFAQPAIGHLVAHQAPRERQRVDDRVAERPSIAAQQGSVDEAHVEAHVVPDDH